MRHRHRMIAAIYDRVCAAQERAFLASLRAEVVGQASGVVVEVGAGTGLNFAHYRPARVRHVEAVEPDPFMRRRAEPRARQAGVPISLLEGAGERLPFSAGYAESVVMTLVLCSVDDPGQVALELRRMLKPGGSLLFIEHVRSEEPWRARLQDWITPLWSRMAANCHVNRSSLIALRQVGFEVEETNRVPRGGPWGNPIVAGRARAPLA